MDEDEMSLAEAQRLHIDDMVQRALTLADQYDNGIITRDMLGQFMREELTKETNDFVTKWSMDYTDVVILDPNEDTDVSDT